MFGVVYTYDLSSVFGGLLDLLHTADLAWVNLLRNLASYLPSARITHSSTLQVRGRSPLCFGGGVSTASICRHASIKGPRDRSRTVRSRDLNVGWIKSNRLRHPSVL